MDYEKCREILLKECELVQNAAAIQKKIQDAVANREWTDFEDHFKAMNAVEGEFMVLENKRESLFIEFEAARGRRIVSPELNDAKGRFYAMTACLPADQRNDLTAIYRSLKLEVLKLRMANDALGSYLGGVKASLAEFFELAFPDRGGKMYTSQGTHLSHDMRSVVLNQRF
jgi:hypothetical protein